MKFFLSAFLFFRLIECCIRSITINFDKYALSNQTKGYIFRTKWDKLGWLKRERSGDAGSSASRWRRRRARWPPRRRPTSPPLVPESPSWRGTGETWAALPPSSRNRKVRLVWRQTQWMERTTVIRAPPPPPRVRVARRGPPAPPPPWRTWSRQGAQARHPTQRTARATGHSLRLLRGSSRRQRASSTRSTRRTEVSFRVC